MKKLKSDGGVVVEVPSSACYQPDKNGYTIAALGGFAYFRGRETKDEVTHVVRDPNCGLAERGDLVPVGGEAYESWQRYNQYLNFIRMKL